MAGCACVATKVQGPKGEASAAVSLAASASSDASTSTLLLLLGGGLLLCALVCQLVLEKLLAHAATKAVRDLLANCPDFPVELGRMRVWIFPGRLELRNCSVHSPRRYSSDRLLHLRCLTV